MDWIRQNRFLAVFLAVMVLGGGGLSFLVYNGASRYAQVSQEYQSQVAELRRLQQLEPYPDAANLQRYNQVKTDYAATVTNFQKGLAAFQPAAENPPPTPLQFQDRLRRVVDEVTKSAQQAGVGLPEGFYLGFEQYRGTPPDTAATPALSAQLDAIRDLLDIMIKQRIEKLTAIKRAPLPQELAGAPTGPGGRPTAAGLITRNAAQFEFTALPSAFRDCLARITTAPRLYIVSALRVKNDMEVGPHRGLDTPGGGRPGGGQPPVGSGAPPPSPPPGEPGAPGQPPAPEKSAAPLRYVVGLEKLSVVARIDLVRVAPPQ